MNRYSCYEYLTLLQFKYMMLENNFVHSYVIKDEDDNVIDFFSFIRYNTSIKDSDQRITRAQVYYYSSDEETIYSIMRYIIILANNKGCDVVDALDIHENMEVTDSLKFDKGSGELYYYMYNWKTPNMEPSRMGKMFIA